MDFIYSVDSSDVASLKKILEANQYDKDSFSSLGYTLRDASSLSIEEKKTFLYFSVNDGQLKDSLLKKLSDAKIGSLTEVSSDLKNKIISSIKESEDQAASGFGSIFG